MHKHEQCKNMNYIQTWTMHKHELYTTWTMHKHELYTNLNNVKTWTIDKHEYIIC